jgi:hypothetical protein
MAVAVRDQYPFGMIAIWIGLKTCQRRAQHALISSAALTAIAWSLLIE